MKLKARLQSELKAMHDPVYFVHNFLGLEPYPMQSTILKDFYNPSKSYNELVVVAGMRGGKTVLGSMIGAYEAFKLISLGDPQSYYGLMPDQDIYIMGVATSERQAKETIFAALKNQLLNSWWFQEQEMEIRHREIRFPQHNVRVTSEHSNSSSLAGRTAKVVFLDETARFKDGSGKFSGESVYSTVSRAVATFGIDGKIVSISSPIFSDDFQMRLYRKSQKSKFKEQVLGYQLATWELNPKPEVAFNSPFMQNELKKNPETFWRDFGAIPPKAYEGYFGDPDKIDEVATLENAAGPNEIIQKTGKQKYTYICAGDPAVKNDSFGIAVGHMGDDGKIYIDLTHRFTPTDGKEINALEVRDYLFKIKKHFPFRRFITDIWNFPETLQSLADTGVIVDVNVVKKKEYDQLKELIYNKNIYLPRDEYLLNELKSLELVHGRKVDHPITGSKDVADAVANVVNAILEETWTAPDIEYVAPTESGYTFTSLLGEPSW